ncbi:hypothetical protein AAF712_015490 [Marasmius tenuissimus]|uniref:F-box domain-containing protein n=1 Tax=Marasmius tenuissimus TaxID=585030 RepID=A0ABR2ZAD9_9AGAR
MPSITSNPPILQLPTELKNAIFTELVKITRSSTSLLAPSSACRDFRDLLLDAPSLWIHVRIDFKSMRFAEGCGCFPGLRTILKRSKDRYISLSIHLEGANRTEDSLLQHFITPAHLTGLTDILSEEGIPARVRDLAVRCSVFSHIETIMGFWTRERPLLRLESFMIWFSYGSGLGMLDLDEEDEDLFPTVQCPILVPESALDQSTSALVRYSEATLPALERVFVQGIPMRYRSFFPSYLTTLSLFEVVRLSAKEFSRILDANRYSLRVLDLGHDVVPVEAFERRVTLPHLFKLSISVIDPRELVALAKSVELPRLSQLSITDMFNRLRGFEMLLGDGGYTDEEGKSVQDAFLEMYNVIGGFWSLDKVKKLILKDIVFYEAEGNAISLLSESRGNRVDWQVKGRGVPIASRFFAQFTSLEKLVLSSPDDSVLVAFYNQPYRWDEEEKEFEPVFGKWFPQLKCLESP